MLSVKKISLLLASTLLASASTMSFAQTAGDTTNSDATTKPATASCKIQNPQEFTQYVIDEKVLAILKQNKDKLKSDLSSIKKSVEHSLEPYMAIKTMSEFVAGSIYTNASSDEQSAFNKAFYDFITSTYSSALSDYNNQTVVVYKLRTNDWQQPSTQRILVHSVVKSSSGAPDTPVAFVLLKDNCKWLFLDFVVENISAMGNIRSQFQSLIQRGQTTLPDLTKVLVKKNNSGK